MLLLPLRVICSASEFLWRHLVKEAQALVRAWTFYDTNPLPHAKTMNSSPPPTTPGECDFTCNPSLKCVRTVVGGGALFTFHPVVLELFVFFAWAPVLLADQRGDRGQILTRLNAVCDQERGVGFILPFRSLQQLLHSPAFPHHEDQKLCK